MPDLPVTRLLVGGPAYRLELDARHASAMIALTAYVERKCAGEITFMGAMYEHGCPVEQARNALFPKSLEVADYLLWMDSDVYFDPMDSISIVDLFRGMARADIPFLGVPCPQRNGVANVWMSRDKRLESIKTNSSSRRFHRCYAMGLGMTLLYLPWYRKHQEQWQKEGEPWFRTAWDREKGLISEDHWHTRQIAAHGAEPRYTDALIAHHIPRGGA